MYCPNCGLPNRKDERFCIHCKESFNDLEELEGFMGNPPLKKFDWLKAFFDFSFTQFVSPKLIKFLYILSFLFAGLLALFFIIVGFRVSPLFGIFALIIGTPIIFLSIAIYSRVFLETVLRASKMAKNLVSQREIPKSDNAIQWNVD